MLFVCSVPRSVDDPPNPFHEVHLEWDEPPVAGLRVYEERARTALSRNESPDIPFRFSVNPYRGCFHACAYCYARPSHGYLDFGAGTGFDRQIVVKTNIAERLAEAFAARRWKGEPVTFSGNTDCYQPLEARYGLTRACLQVCLAHRNPITIITKNKLVVRDTELLSELARQAGASVSFSVPFADDAMARAIEPGASSPTQRFAAMRALSDAGVPTALMIGPVIPGLNEHQIPALLERAQQAGARAAHMLLLRLAPEVEAVFTPRLREAYPDRADKVLSALREMRGGGLVTPRFGARMRGEGERWGAVEQLFELHRKRLGLGDGLTFEDLGAFRRPTAQLSLFE